MYYLFFMLCVYSILNSGYCNNVNSNKERINETVYSQNRFKARIIGGKPSDLEKSGYQVLLKIHMQDGSFYFYGGSIIGQKWVLTAAHCNRTGTMRVYALPLQGPEHSIGVLKSHIFPKPNGTNGNIDYMLLELERNFVFTNIVHQIELVDTPLAIIPGKNGTAAGWGLTVFEGKHASKILMEVDLPIMEHAKCKQSYKNLNVNEFCVGYGDGYEDDSKNVGVDDSGGGFVVDGKLLGVIIRVNQLIGIIASVPYIRAWICQVTGI